MNKLQRMKLAQRLEAQGGDVRRTKKGWIARKPGHARAVIWHASPSSDVKGVRRLKQDTRLAGFVWPGEG